MGLPRGVRNRAKSSSLPLNTESRLTMTGMAAASLLLGWAAIAAGTFVFDQTLSIRFLDMPLGAFLAGQGALVGLVVVGVRVSRLSD